MLILNWTCYRCREGKGKWRAKKKCLIITSSGYDGHCEIRGIRKCHQIITEPYKLSGIFITEYGFINVYIKGRVKSCQAVEPSQYFRHSIDVMKVK